MRCVSSSYRRKRKRERQKKKERCIADKMRKLAMESLAGKLEIISQL